MINRSLSEPIEENNSSKPYSGRHVIFCEGKTDISFLGAFFQTENISRADFTLDALFFEDCKGKDQIPDKLSKSFQDLDVYDVPPKAFIVVLDGDVHKETGLKLAKDRFKKYQTFFKIQGLEIKANNRMSETPNDYGLYGGIFIIDGEDYHDLESLCLKITTKFQQDNRYQAIVTTFQEQRQQLTEKPQYPSKSDVAVYLASMPEFCSSLGLALKKGYFDTKILRDIFQELIAHLSNK